MDWRFKLSTRSVETSLAFGSLFFLITFVVCKYLANWDDLPAAGISATFFVLSSIGAFMIVNNIVDAYTMEIALKLQTVDERVDNVQAQIDKIDDSEFRILLRQICEHTNDLIMRTRENQPNSLSSVLTVLSNWLVTIDNGLKQYVDVQNNPVYHDNPIERLTKARQAFESFDSFLINSIRSLEKGDNVAFDVAVQMLDASRFSIV